MCDRAWYMGKGSCGGILHHNFLNVISFSFTLLQDFGRETEILVSVAGCSFRHNNKSRFNIQHLLV